MTDHEEGYVGRVTAWLAEWESVAEATGAVIVHPGVTGGAESNLLLAPDLRALPDAVTAGYVEYGVRCPAGTVHRRAKTADAARRLAVEYEAVEYGSPCPGGPHEVVQHTVGPWEVSR